MQQPQDDDPAVRFDAVIENMRCRTPAIGGIFHMKGAHIWQHIIPWPRPHMTWFGRQHIERAADQPGIARKLIDTELAQRFIKDVVDIPRGSLCQAIA